MKATGTETLAGDLIWNIKGIAAFIGRTPRQTYEALVKGELPARQVNGRWVSSKTALAKHFGVDERGAA
jgi:hypothetical protein